MAAGVAHDFNNILTIIQGHADLLLQTPASAPENEKSIRTIAAAAERAGQLIKQMLALSRKQIMLRKPLDVQETLVHTADLLSPILGEQVVLKFEMCIRDRSNSAHIWKHVFPRLENQANVPPASAVVDFSPSSR